MLEFLVMHKTLSVAKRIFHKKGTSCVGSPPCCFTASCSPEHGKVYCSKYYSCLVFTLLQCSIQRACSKELSTVDKSV